MCKKQVSGMNELDWVSVSAYLQWLEVQAELTPFSISDVFSFQVGKGGFDGLVSRKRHLSHVLQANLKNLERWANGNKDSMGESEMVFVRSVWQTTHSSLETVQSHLVRAQALKQSEHAFKIPTSEEEKNEPDLPF